MNRPVTIDTIRQAQRHLQGHVVRTPLVAAPALSEITGVDVRLKLENLQLTGAFKARGALIKLISLPPEARRAGVIAVPAGNHAQGVAWHAGKLGIPATIVMPVATPMTKIQRTEALGGHRPAVRRKLQRVRGVRPGVSRREGIDRGSSLR